MEKKTRRLIEAAQDDAARRTIAEATPAELVAAILKVAPNAHIGPRLAAIANEIKAEEEPSETDAAVDDFELLQRSADCAAAEAEEAFEGVGEVG